MFSNIRKILQHIDETTNLPAMICGGAVRDAMNNKPIRDYDLYVSTVENGWDKIEQALFGTSYDDSIEWFSGDNAEYTHQSIQMRREGEWNGLLIDLIGLRWDTVVKIKPEVENVINNYNIGLSQVGISVAGIKWTDAFAKDMKDKTVTVLREDWGHEATAKSMRKYAVKYPEYRQVYLDGTPYDENEFLSRMYMAAQINEPY